MKKLSLKRTLTFITILSVFAIVFYNTKDLILGAPLVIKTVKDGSTIEDSFLEVSGLAKHALTVQINGRNIAVDKKGSFRDAVVLSPGYNIVEISQKDRFGKEKRKVLHLVAEPSASVATVQEIHYQ